MTREEQIEVYKTYILACCEMDAEYGSLDNIMTFVEFQEYLTLTDEELDLLMKVAKRNTEMKGLSFDILVEKSMEEMSKAYNTIRQK